MCITKQPSIYNSGLTEKDIENLMSNYIDISDKFNLKSNMTYTYFIVKYNKLTRICYVRIQVANYNFSTGITEIATPKNDCPLSEIGNIFAMRKTENPTSECVDTILTMKNNSLYCYTSSDVENTNATRIDANGITICELK